MFCERATWNTSSCNSVKMCKLLSLEAIRISWFFNSYDQTQEVRSTIKKFLGFPENLQ